MRKGIALGLVLILLLTLSGCAGKQEPAGENSSIVVGFSQLGAESSWRMANTASMEQAAREAGYGLMMENANQKQEKQIDAIRSFIAYRVDVIVFSPIVEADWDNVLSEAKQAGIPVILMDRMIETKDDSLYTAYIGADFYAEGRKAGEYLVRKADAIGADHLRAGVRVDLAGLAVDHLGMALHDLDVVALQQGADATGQAADDAVLPFDRAGEIDGGMLDPQAEGGRGRLLDGMMIGLGGMDDRLRGNAADIEAGAAQPAAAPALLDQHGIEAELARTNGGDITSGPATHDQYLGSNVGHVRTPGTGSPASRAVP